VNRRKVKITGVGIVSSCGVGIVEFGRNIISSKSFVSAINRFPKDGGDFVASEVRNFSISKFTKNVGATRAPRHTQFAIAASLLALKHASIPVERVRELAPLVITGTSLMDSDVINKTIENVTKRGPRFALARVVFQGPVSSVAATVADHLGGARTLTIQSACCSGLDAIGRGAELVSLGESDIAICGGAEAPIFYHPMLELKMAGLSPATTASPEALCRPFDLWRTTGVIGEGACVCVIEPESSPRRGLAYIKGYGYSTDHPSNLNMGLPQSIRFCLSDAGVRSGEVAAISAWGPGHKEIDAMEAHSIFRVFGRSARNIPVSSIKGTIGNPFAAGGAMQVGAAVFGMCNSVFPPTVNWSVRDPDCDLRLSCFPRYFSYNNVLVNAHGISGTNSCMLLERCT
jgi:3-oxoacyl-(acyl-carrier-protein) synthase